MSQERAIDGRPYGAIFFDRGDDGEASNAAALVRPPFDVSRVQPLIEMYMGTHLGLEEIASTQSATALSFSMTYPESTEQTHEDRLNEAYKGLSTLIEKLNAIENGTWKGWD